MDLRWNFSSWFWAILSPMRRSAAVVTAMVVYLRLIWWWICSISSRRILTSILSSLLRGIWLLYGLLRIWGILRLRLCRRILLSMLLGVWLGLLGVRCGRLLRILLGILIVTVPLRSLIVLRPLGSHVRRPVGAEELGEREEGFASFQCTCAASKKN